MATTIVLKNSVTTTNAPSSLAQGEVAINVTDKKVWVGNAATTPIQIVNGGPDGVFTSVTDSGLTNTRVTYAGAGGLLKDSASITTDGTTVTAGGFSGPHNGTVGATTPAAGTFTTLTATNFNAASTFGFKNRIINGNMVIDQRNAGASVATTTTAAYTYTLDRWFYIAAQASKFTVQQNAGSVTPPAGFINYLGCTSTSAYSVGASDYFLIGQQIEGLNVADLGWGTANAKTVTLSFQVYSSLTGTFAGALRNSAVTRSYPFTYTVSTANTWTSISVTIVGDTSGTWLTTNGIGIALDFSLGTGSTFSGTAGAWASANYLSATGATSVVGTNGATFYITGVQLEVGSSATNFEVRDYGTELVRCQRYYEKSFAIATAPVTNLGANTGEVLIGCNTALGNMYTLGAFFRVTKRTTPTVTLYNRQNASNDWVWYTAAGTTSNAGTVESSGQTVFNMTYVGSTTQAITTGHWVASAEL